MESNKLNNNPKKYVEKKYFNIEVKCILYDLTDANDDSIKYVKDYCHSNNILYSTRKYNSYSHRHDRDYISKLPAFHIYINNNHQRTFYPNTRPLQHIDEVIMIYIENEEKKKKKKEKWDKIKSNIRKIFSIDNIINLFHKKSLLEKTKENEVEEIKVRRKSFSDFENLKRQKLF